MKKKILIMGLPGAGKTYLAERLAPLLGATWLNADKVRKDANDWDFSPEGRQRQASRMKNLAQKSLENEKHVIADLSALLQKQEKILEQILQFGWIQLQKVDLKILIKCLFLPNNMTLELKKKWRNLGNQNFR